MRYTQQIIEKTLDKCKIQNRVFFIGIMPSFVFDKKTNEVVSYDTQITNNNDLIVLLTDIVTIEISLEDYLSKLKISIKDVLVFCVNQDFIPKENQIRLKIIEVK